MNPSSTSQLHRQASHGFDSDAWIAVIGPSNQAYYLKTFAKLHATGGRFQPTWHWPTFFSTWTWLLYRRLWRLSVGYLAYFLFVAYFGAIAMALVLWAFVTKNEGVATLLAVGYFLVATFVVPPGMANWLYYRHCLKKIARFGQDAKLEAARSPPASTASTSRTAVVVGVSGVVAIVWYGAYVALTAFEDHPTRAFVASALEFGEVAARQAGAQFEATGRMPSRVDEVPKLRVLPEHQKRKIKSTSINPDTGAIEIVTTFVHSQTPVSIILVPSIDSGGHVTWACKTASNTRHLVPRRCGGDS